MSESTLPFRSPAELAARIDHAVLSPGATPSQVRVAADACVLWGVRALVVLPSHVAVAAKALSGHRVVVAAVVGFPLGATTSPAKQFEALECEKLGATELDVVLNVGAVKEGDLRYVERELLDVLRRTPECVHKIIIETGLLSASEVVDAVSVVNTVGPRYIKTCTGYGPRGVTVADVELIRRDLGRGILVKASGGIRDLAAAEALVASGATLLGMSSTFQILTELGRLTGGPTPRADGAKGAR